MAQFPALAEMQPLSRFDLAELSSEIQEKLGELSTPVLIARFFCGLNTPVFSRLRVRKLKGFAFFENYRFSEVKTWVEGKSGSLQSY